MRMLDLCSVLLVSVFTLGCQEAEVKPPSSRQPDSAAKSDDAASKSDPIKDELAKLAGDWVRSQLEMDGKQEDSPPGHSLTIRGDQWMEKSPNAPEANSSDTIKIDPSKSPKQIELTSSEKTPAGETLTVTGIYELDGDTLKVCQPFPFGEDLTKLKQIPTEFTTQPGGDFVTTIYTRKQK